MHFTRSLIAFAAFAATAVVQAAPGLNTSLKRNWCGYEATCDCHEDVATGCVLQLDDCSKEHFWPPQCTGCGSCSQLCVDCKRSFIEPMGGSR
ncbi:hypothetical protein B0H13DRAFT_347066 [Mycena leptocephala]|nr:hypothetical protein B0H13DRAFT_347066 [Mycena leptocephala]